MFQIYYIFAQVHGVYHTYYEMKHVKPKMQSLRLALARHMYKGKDTELHSENKEGLSFTDLKQIIQASEAEILNQLNELHAVKIKSKWRLLDVALLYGWVTHLDSILREKQFPLSEITIDEVEDWMELYEVQEVNVKCISMFIDTSGQLLKWNSLAVSQLFALYLLPELKAFDSHDFFSVWQESVPLGVVTCEDHLRGVAVVDNDSTPPLVRYLPEFELPEEINERLDVLFRTRTKWILADIAPYIQ